MKLRPSVQRAARGLIAPRSRAGGQAVVLVAAGVIGLAVAGCGGSTGGSSSTGSGGGGSASPASGTSKLERFAECMRSHGEPSYPDPNAQGRIQLPSGMSTSSPQYQRAFGACKSLAPAGPQTGQPVSPANLSKALKFVACMRSHGVPSFPDPTAQGKFNGGGAGLPVNSPQFFSAFERCRPLLPAGSGFGGTGA